MDRRSAVDRNCVHDREDPGTSIVLPFDGARVGKETGDPGMPLDKPPGLGGVKKSVDRARYKQIGFILANWPLGDRDALGKNILLL